jgi:hypothetical protein
MPFSPELGIKCSNSDTHRLRKFHASYGSCRKAKDTKDKRHEEDIQTEQMKYEKNLLSEKKNIFVSLK